jgi:hypothetical protein
VQSLPDDDKLRLIAIVGDLRRAAEIDGDLFELQAVYDMHGLERPEPLFGQLSGYLHKTAAASETDTARWRDTILGAYYPKTRQIYVDDQLPWAKQRQVAAHEFMHDYLGHGQLALGPSSRTAGRGGEMEREADFCGLELLAPARDFAVRIAEATATGGRTTISDTFRVAAMFGVTPFTALRRYVETSARSVAVLSLRVPAGYKGSRPQHMNAAMHKSREWVHGRGGPADTVMKLDVSRDRIARLASAVLNGHRHDRAEAEADSLARAAEADWPNAHAEVTITRQSAHFLLTGTTP